MILKDETTGKKVVISNIEEITLDRLKKEANKLCEFSQPIIERKIIASFPIEIQSRTSTNEYLKSIRIAIEEYHKVLLEVKTEVDRSLELASKYGLLQGSEELPNKNLKDFKFRKIRFTEVFIRELGNLVIKPVENDHRK